MSSREHSVTPPLLIKKLNSHRLVYNNMDRAGLGMMICICGNRTCKYAIKDPDAEEEKPATTADVYALADDGLQFTLEL
jgi:hypothetical protein